MNQFPSIAVIGFSEISSLILTFVIVAGGGDVVVVFFGIIGGFSVVSFYRDSFMFYSVLIARGKLGDNGLSVCT